MITTATRYQALPSVHASMGAVDCCGLGEEATRRLHKAYSIYPGDAQCLASSHIAPLLHSNVPIFKPIHIMITNMDSPAPGPVLETGKVDSVLHVEDASADTGHDDDEDWKLTPGKFLAMLAFQLGYLSDVFALSMISSLLEPINRDIGPSPNYTWMVTSQIIGAAVLAPVTGRLSDIFGRRNFLLLGNCFGIIGTAVAATAHDVNTVIGASCLIGVASSMHQLAWACLGELVPNRSRGVALGWFQTSLAPAGAFAPIIGMW